MEETLWIFNSVWHSLSRDSFSAKFFMILIAGYVLLFLTLFELLYTGYLLVIPSCIAMGLAMCRLGCD